MHTTSFPVRPALQILPQKGSILPHGKQRVSVEFVSQQVMKYSAHSLVLDIPRVAQSQLVLPIRAECAVPKISMESATLDCGDCFVRYPYKQTIKLLNSSKLPAKFEVQPQDHGSLGLASFTVEPLGGGIPAMGEQELEVTLCTQTLGRVQLPVRIKIPGSKGRPLECVIDAKSMGPSLMYGPPDAGPESLRPELAIDYDKVPVLGEHVRLVQVHNPCLIPADFKLFIEGKDSVFSVEPREAHLEPGGSMTAKVTVCMDDNQTFRDVLHVLISEGADVCIPLNAIGTGCTVVCEELAGSMVDFAHQFVGRPFQQTYVVHNNGRKGMQLVWSNGRYDQVKLQYSKAARAAGEGTVPVYLGWIGFMHGIGMGLPALPC